eukprot:249837_1
MSDSKDFEMHEHQFQVFVRIVTGREFKTFTLNVTGSDLIQEITQQLSIKTGVSASLITLSYRSRMLYPDKTIEFYNIQRESTLNATATGNKMPNINSNEGSGTFGAFPVSILNAQLNTKINTIDSSINKLNKTWETQIINSNSINNLNKIWQQIQNTYNNEAYNLNNNKLKYLRDIYSNNEIQKQSAQFELDTLSKDVYQIDKCIANIDAKIINFQQIILDLNKQKKYHQTQKLPKENEFTIRNKSVNDLKNESISINNQIIDIHNKLKTDQTVNLRECFQNKLKKFELKYMQWNTNDVIEWVKFIENEQFKENKKFIEAIDNLDICGNNLGDLRNDACLKLIGLNLMERKVILNNIDRVLNRNNDGVDSNICTVCIGKKINTVFIPCGHQSCCFECYEKEKRRFNNCPICRQRILKTIKTFMNGF